MSGTQQVFEIGKVYNGKRIGTSCLHAMFKILKRNKNILTVKFASGKIVDIKSYYNAATNSERMFPEGFSFENFVDVDSRNVINTQWIDVQ